MIEGKPSDWGSDTRIYRQSSANLLLTVTRSGCSTLCSIKCVPGSGHCKYLWFGCLQLRFFAQKLRVPILTSCSHFVTIPAQFIKNPDCTVEQSSVSLTLLERSLHVSLSRLGFGQKKTLDTGRKATNREGGEGAGYVKVLIDLCGL